MTHRSASGRAGVALLVGLVALVAVAGLALATVVASGGSGQQADPDELRCNGATALCDRRLDQVALAGSHNSMSVSVEPGWRLAEQDEPIRGQLDAGIRAFLLDVWPGYPSGDLVRTDLTERLAAAAAEEQLTPPARAALDRLDLPAAQPPPDADVRPYLCHAYCELGASDLVAKLRDMADFLDEHPDEVLVLVLQDYVPASATEKAFREAGLLDRVWQLDPGAPMPTLREMVTSDRNVVVLSENHGGEVAWLPRAYDVFTETPFEFPTISDFSCAPNRGEPDNPLFLVNHWVDDKGRPSPARARESNSRAVLEQRVSDCERERDRSPNVIAVDFADVGDVVGVVRELNRKAGG